MREREKKRNERDYEIKERVKEATVEILRKAETELPADVVRALERAYEDETSEIARTQLRAMIENVKLAAKLKRPICQDTGIPIFFVRISASSSLPLSTLRLIESGIRDGVEEATTIIPLRGNIVHPFTRLPRGMKESNVGKGVPHIHFIISEHVEADIEITVIPKGGGSENVSTLTILQPFKGEQAFSALRDLVVESVLNAGGKPCPPTVIGVGAGGSADVAMMLAKTALLRPVGERNTEENIAASEIEILEAVNCTGIGPMGLGGRTTALDVHIEVADCHITGLPVAINFQCWAARRASASLKL
ncbi:MAG: fumarate hydratase [Canidatus Methanoxibalbensis ujae]|nr:fumarate hydratase [Candidatus Methanoxibalbensis ujae]MCW7078828.1 fumarate hydratase [Candidatus Methanoxibalbensis ujae]RLG39096.1 MAG: fumarate hydratase [Methanosarcinales archaeon]